MPLGTRINSFNTYKLFINLNLMKILLLTVVLFCNFQLFQQLEHQYLISLMPTIMPPLITGNQIYSGGLDAFNSLNTLCELNYCLTKGGPK